MNKKFRGVFSVSVTPFDEQGNIDERVLRDHIRWLIQSGCVHGIVPTGSTGEFAYLSDEERAVALRVAVEAAAGDVPVIAGTAACSTRDAVRYAQNAEKAGAMGVMVLPPYYGHLSQKELYHHFASLAGSISIPVMLYNNPGTSGSDLLPETVARLAEIENIAAIKESTGMMQRVEAIQRLCGERIEVLCGCDTLPLEMFLMGVQGWVAAPSNTIPRQCVELYRLAVEQKDYVNARALYRRLLPLFTLFEESGQYVQLNKAALELLGRPVGAPRLPLMPPAPETMAALREALAFVPTMD